MPVVSFKEILDPAFEHRYGVAAFNIVNDLTLEAVLAAAAELDSPRDRADLGEDGEVDRRRRALQDVPGDGRRRRRCRSRCTSTTALSAEWS